MCVCVCMLEQLGYLENCSCEEERKQEGSHIFPLLEATVCCHCTWNLVLTAVLAATEAAGPGVCGFSSWMWSDIT